MRGPSAPEQRRNPASSHSFILWMRCSNRKSPNAMCGRSNTLATLCSMTNSSKPPSPIRSCCEPTSCKPLPMETVAGSETLVQLTADFAKAGQGTQADADRSQAELALRRNNVARSDEAVAVASARLVQVLSLNGARIIRPVENALTPIDLVPCEGAPQESVAIALANRPELQESRDLVGAACERLRREKYAPLVPSVLLGASYTGFGGGMGDTVADVNDRTDFDAIAVWQIRNLGYGEQAAREAASARVQQARLREVQIMDQVAREVTEAQARVATRRNRISVAEGGIKSARSSYERDFTRIREGQGLPIEVLQAIQSLDATRRDLVDATVDFNSAQFQLQRALGWPVQ